jgi:hypothetical protein
MPKPKAIPRHIIVTLQCVTIYFYSKIKKKIFKNKDENILPTEEQRQELYVNSSQKPCKKNV